MASVRRRPFWELPGLRVTDESVWVERRRFLAAMGLGGAAALGLAVLGRREVEDALLLDPGDLPPLAARRPRPYRDAGRALTPPRVGTRTTNYYELSGDKRAVPWRARHLALSPWELVVDGLVRRPGAWGPERLAELGLEERVYRHRCVEAWAMTLPWTGVPLARLLEAVEPLPAARFVAFQSVDARRWGLAPPEGFPFPYHEALRLDEAAHPLTLLATGLYGHALTPQNGGPVRLVVPWKYGYKGAKSLVRLTLAAERPPSFWNVVAPHEYGWLANVDPTRPHPRWSQASERLVATGELVPTRPLNGYDVGLYA